VAIAGIELLKSDEIQSNIDQIIRSHQKFDTQIKNHPKVKTTRQMGVIFALDLDIEMDRYGKKRYQIFDHFMEHGVCLRPLGKTIYILPPYVITKEQLHKIYDTIVLLVSSL